MATDWLDSGLLGRVRQIVRSRPCLLVGGAVRDHLLGRPVHDLDLVAGRDVAAVLAEKLPARLIELGGERFAALRLAGEGFVIDLWDRGEASLEEELARRDLTINSIAVDLADGEWYDPCAGRRDIHARILRATTDQSFAADALRTLRLARFAAEFGDFTVAAHSLDLAAAAVGGLSAVAAERRREELGRTLEAARPAAGLDVWGSIGFYPQVLVPPGDVDDPAATLATARRALRRADERLALFAQLGTAQPDRHALHAALMLAAAGADVEALVEGGWVSRREARAIAFVLPCRRLPTRREDQRWLLYSSAKQWPAALCHAAIWEDRLPRERAAETLASIIELAGREAREIFTPEPLLRGDEIRELLGLEPGPEVGEAAKRLRRRQIEGRLRDRDDAVAWLLSERR
ncbi:MAG: hypothetical protein O7A98_11230 [Acidobacteria bacterium]|nr:hypothetical protein [Acidobacteriota bacterium]